MEEFVKLELLTKILEQGQRVDDALTSVADIAELAAELLMQTKERVGLQQLYPLFSAIMQQCSEMVGKLKQVNINLRLFSETVHKDTSVQQMQNVLDVTTNEILQVQRRCTELRKPLCKHYATAVIGKAMAY